MYIRPQLSRKRTCDREVLEREHKQDVLLHEKALQSGSQFEQFSEQLSEIIQGVDNSDALSLDDKQSILREISDALHSMKVEYDMGVRRDLGDIEFSMEERISEMEDAAQQWSEETFRQEKTVYDTASVDAEKLRFAAADLLKKYNMLIEKSKAELQIQIEKSEQQRDTIRKNISRRGG